MTSTPSQIAELKAAGYQVCPTNGHLCWAVFDSRPGGFRGVMDSEDECWSAAWAHYTAQRKL